MPTGLDLLDDVELNDALFAPVLAHARLALAVSGGADSLALLALAQRWAERHGKDLVVYSVDHGLRTAASAEVGMVLDVAQARGLKARGLAWTGPYPASGVQAAARAARYQLIRGAMVQDNVAVVLTGHHLHDQAETVLMRMAHGSGLAGLKGMTAFSEVEGINIFRPLLAVSPEQLVQICAKSGLSPVDDPSNHDTHYERVRWRALLPQLAAMGLDGERLADFAARMAEAQAVIDLGVDNAETRLVVYGSEDAVMACGEFAALPQAIAVPLLQRVLRKIGGGKKPRALGAVEMLYSALTAPKRFGGRTLHGCTIRRCQGTIAIGVEAGRSTKDNAVTAGNFGDCEDVLTQ